MGKDEEAAARRDTPPATAGEWAMVWLAIERIDKAWTVVGPVYAVVSNWKALLFVFAFVAWINRPGIAEAIRVIVGVEK